MTFRTRPALAVMALIAGLSAGSAGAREQSEKLLYDIMLGGLHVGDTVVTFSQTPDRYQSTLEMRSRGMLQWFQNFRAAVTSEGALVTGGPAITPLPAVYRREWAAPEMAAYMTMTFDPTTGLTTSEERMFNPATGETLRVEDMPWNSRRRPIPQVPEELRRGALDPVAAFVGARTQILASKSREVRMPIYDGRRRYDIVSTVGNPRVFTIRDMPRELVPVVSRVEPVFGFEPDAEDRMRESEGRILFSNDDRFVPVQVILGNDMFSSVMNLVAECNVDPQPCDAFGAPNAAQDTAAN
ncbi:MAG: DUF3108 domain-containing protein [Rhodospirillaceae bacterium]|nr:DUF3108 domain-containing protein [Rhodospirillaceae bacterium]